MTGSGGRLEVAVIGGGIGGLTAAAALRHHGLEARVYEAAPAPQPAGAGLTLQPNAMQLLRRLGLAEPIVAAGLPLGRAEIHDLRGGLLQRLDFAEPARRYGVPTVAIHRQRLHAILLDALPPDRLHPGAACTRVDTVDDRARIGFADGREVEADLAVGADGLHSVVREHVAPGARLRYSGQTSWRGIAALSAPDGGVAREIWDAGRRFGFVPIAAREVYWFATLDAPAGEMDPPEGPAERLARLFAAFPAPVADLLAATDATRIIRTDIGDVEPFRGWSRGRVVLLGDAAHATTPNLGQGAAQAVEDAWVLAQRLAAGPTVGAALRDYEEARAAKARRIVERSRTVGALAHLSSPFARRLRNLLMRWTPDSLTRRELDRAYALDD